MLKLAFRNILRHYFRTTMTLAAIAFGVIGLILSGGFSHDVYEQLGEALIHSQSGHIQISKAGFHAKGTRNPERYLLDDPDTLRRIVSAMPAVMDEMARVNFSGLINNGRTDWSIVGEGIEAEKEALLGSQLKITSGRQLSEADTNGVLLGQGVAKALKLRPGDQVTLLVNVGEGALNNLDFEVIGIFQTFSADFDARAVRIPLAAAKDLLATSHINTLVLSLHKTSETQSIASSIRSKLDASVFEVNTWIDLNDFYASTVELYERQFGVLRLIILILVLLSVANSVNMSIFERLGEFGTMMALGNHQLHIFRLLLVENALLGIIGGALGALFGVALAYVISTIGIPMPPPPNANIGYTAHILIIPSIVFDAFLIGAFATFLAAIIPAWRVSRVRVDEALRLNI